MEEYLGRLNLEWEYAISGLSVDQTEIAVTALPILMPALLHSEEGGMFRSEFRSNYRAAIGALSSGMRPEGD